MKSKKLDSPKLLFIMEDSHLGIHRKEKGTEIETFAQLIKILVSEDHPYADRVEEIVKLANFIENDEVRYNNLPVAVHFVQIPVILGSEILVKVVFLRQADNYILIIPENVNEVFKRLLESPALLVDENLNLDLYAEVFGFDTDDQKLIELIKTSFLGAGNAVKAFDFATEQKKEDKEDYDTADEQPTGGSKTMEDSFDTGGFEDFGDVIEDIPEVDTNLESYKKFKNFKKSVYKALKTVYNNSSQVIKNNVKVGFIKPENAVAVIEVNNKEVYTKLKNSPKIAKQTLTEFGQALRNDKSIQLLDSFIKSGKRYFVITETGNFWTVKHERLSELGDDTNYIDPIQSNIVRLERSEIRQDARTLVPYRKNKKIVFKGDLVNEKYSRGKSR